MNRLFSIAFILTMVSFCHGQNDGHVSELNIEQHVYHLASDELGGRGTNSKGYIEASDYAAKLFKDYGLQPVEGADGYFQNFDLTSRQATNIRSKQDFETATSRNVIGVVPGTDPALKEQYIVLTAHLDHVGTINGEIHNGANDNATGSALVMELARVIAENPGKRSVMFILFGAEEIGLVGSNYYVEHPLIPLSKTFANLNTDGVGAYINQPGDQAKLLALGADATCDELLNRLNTVNESTEKFELATDDPQNYLRRSDQYHFHRKGIPVIMFTDYGNGHYHRPTDDAHRLQYGKLARLANLIHRLTMNLADGAPLCEK